MTLPTGLLPDQHNQPLHLRLHRLNRERLGQKSSRSLRVSLVWFPQGFQPWMKCGNQQDGQLGMRIRETLQDFLASQPGMRVVSST